MIPTDETIAEILSEICNRRGSRQIVENDVKSHSRDARDGEQNAVREELARTLEARGCELTIGASIQVQELFTRWVDEARLKR